MILLGYGLFFLHFDQVRHFAHHAENLRRGGVFHRVVQLFDSQSLKGQLLAFWTVDGASHLGDNNLAHDLIRLVRGEQRCREDQLHLPHCAS